MKNNLTTSLHLHFVNLFIVFIGVVLLIIMSITQRKLLNALITLGIILSLSVGLGFGFKTIKTFQNFRKFPLFSIWAEDNVIRMVTFDRMAGHISVFLKLCCVSFLFNLHLLCQCFRTPMMN